MATYNENALIRLRALKDLALRINKDYATKNELKTLTNKVDDLVTVGGEPNKIESITVNGTACEISEKVVDLTLPTKVSELTNDSKFQTDADVAAAMSAFDHLQRKKVDNLDAIDVADKDADKYIYMVPNAKSKDGNKFDEYMVLDGAVERVGDWEVDLSNYVQKENISTDEEVTEMLNEVFPVVE